MMNSILPLSSSPSEPAVLEFSRLQPAMKSPNHYHLGSCRLAIVFSPSPDDRPPTSKPISLRHSLSSILFLIRDLNSPNAKNNQAIKSLTSQLRDMVLKTSGAYKHCALCTTGTGPTTNDNHQSLLKTNPGVSVAKNLGG
ncbi:unnamed protein product [Linum trigynum]|uniref:Transcription factor BREVIS RADIX N-terminal domain-containing protein n=1 Tax=Linum trigynum TaxID=586398 RepID=A0AAV2GU46_9ROSI